MCGVGKGSFDARDKVRLGDTIVFGIVFEVLFAVAYMMCSRLSVCCMSFRVWMIASQHVMHEGVFRFVSVI